MQCMSGRRSSSASAGLRQKCNTKHKLVKLLQKDSRASQILARASIEEQRACKQGQSSHCTCTTLTFAMLVHPCARSLHPVQQRHNRATGAVGERWPRYMHEESVSSVSVVVVVVVEFAHPLGSGPNMLSTDQHHQKAKQ